MTKRDTDLWLFQVKTLFIECSPKVKSVFMDISPIPTLREQKRRMCMSINTPLHVHSRHTSSLRGVLVLFILASLAIV